jgi:restriction endonuclease S subunit
MTDWPVITINELFDTKSKRLDALMQKDYLAVGKFSVVDQGQELVGGYTNNEQLVRDFGSPVIVFGDHTRCVKYVDFPFASGADGTKILVPREGVDPKFAYFQLLSIDLPAKGYARHFGELSKTSFVLPPLQVQRKIVALLDAVTARVTEITACYEQARTHANNLFTSASREAFESNPDWPVETIGDVCAVLDSLRKPITKRDRTSGDYPYYGATGIVDHVGDYIFDERLVLVGEDGAKWDAGDRTAFIAEGKYWVNNHAHVLRCKPGVLVDSWLTHYLTMSDLNRYVSGLTVPKLNQGSLVSIAIPVPPLVEQKRIVARLDSMRAKTSEMVAAYDAKLQAAKDLRQSILEAAFVGDL